MAEAYNDDDADYNNNSCPSFVLQFYFRAAKATLTFITLYTLFSAIAASTANSFISMTTSTVNLLDEFFDLLPEELNEPQIAIPVYGGFGAIILFAIASNIHQRFFKNKHKIEDTYRINACCPDNRAEELSSADVSAAEEEGLELSELRLPTLNYPIYPKAPANIFVKANALLTGIGELVLGAGSAFSLINEMGRLFGSPSWWKVLNYLSIPAIGVPSAVSFISILMHQQGIYDHRQLLNTFIDEKYKHLSEAKRYALKTALWGMRHVVVDSAIVFGELGDFTSLQFIVASVFGGFDEFTLPLALLICTSVGLSKYRGYHDKACGTLFSVMGGQVYADIDDLNSDSSSSSELQTRTDKYGVIATIKRVTYMGAVFGMLYRNVASTTYQVNNVTNLELAIMVGVLSGVLSAVNVASLYHDLPKVLKEMQESAPAKQANYAVACLKQGLFSRSNNNCNIPDETSPLIDQTASKPPSLGYVNAAAPEYVRVDDPLVRIVSSPEGIDVVKVTPESDTTTGSPQRVFVA